MKVFSLILLLQFASYVSSTGTARPSVELVVRRLYKQIVTRRPLGIPKGLDKAAIWPFLSKGLIHSLETAQACQDSYFQQHAGENGIPAFDWLEVGLFSGANEEAIPSSAAVERTEAQKDGSILVYVRLTYKESFETYGRPPNPANTLRWHVAAVVVPEGGRFVVDDVLLFNLLFKDDSTKIATRLTDSFTGCEGSRWVGNKMKGK